MSDPFYGYTSDKACLHVNLDAAQRNYTNISKLAGGAKVSAVVKADAYGLGMLPLASIFHEAGCRSFYVAHIEGGLKLRQSLPLAEIFSLHGIGDSAKAEACFESAIIPVLNSHEQLNEWLKLAKKTGKKLKAMLHFDSGLNRLGFCYKEAQTLAADDSWRQHIEVVKIMSHLATADSPENILNKRQLDRLIECGKFFPQIPQSLCSSAGVFLGAEYHLDEVRPGAALYGMQRDVGSKSSIIENVTSLMAPLLQWREITASGQVGYGATYEVKKGDKIGIIPVGYADGYPRHLSNCGKAILHLRNGHSLEVNIAGRVSMDLAALDVSAVATEHLGGAVAELFGDNLPISAVARTANTIDLDLLTRLGKRFKRIYIGQNVEAHNNAPVHADEY